MNMLSKSQRLLNADDFKRVFSNPPLKASHRYCLILAKSNLHNNHRLGLVVAKKNVRLAVQRNRIKRLVRESFRHLPSNEHKIDAIVLARKGLDDLDNSTIRQIVDQQWLKIQKKLNACQE